MPDQEYYRSERFIWDNLKIQSATGVASLYKTWKTRGKIEPFVLSWPSEAILDDNGVLFEGACLLDLPDNPSSWSESIRAFVRKTKAYALLLTTQKEKEVQVILESHHGTRSWTIPILVSGDVRILGTAVTKDDTHKIGVLWRTRSNPS
jgi:hypothetical protein